MYCNKCGAKLPDNSNFCYVCGNKVSDIEILFKEAKAQEKIKISEKSAAKNDSTFKKPVKASGEFSSMLEESLDDDTVLLMDKKDKKEKKILRNKASESPKKNLSKKKDKSPSDKSTLKRFIEYMKEEETYDKSFFDKKPSLPDVEKQIEELEEEPKNFFNKAKENVLKQKETSENKVLENLKDEVKKAKTIEIAKTEKISEKEISSNNKSVDLAKKSPATKPGFFKKISNFLKEEDEDRLLDLSYDDYHKLMKGQGDVNYEELLKSLDQDKKVNNTISEDKKDKDSNKIFTSLKALFSPDDKKNSTDIEEVDFDKPLPEEPEDTIKRTTSKPYTFEDKGQTIRYSKTVIDSFLDKHEKGELKLEDFDKIGGLVEDTKPIETQRPIEKKTKKVEEELKATPTQVPIKKEEETYQELKSKPIKKSKAKQKANKEKAKEKVEKEANAKKNYLKLFFGPILEFFKSIGKFFTMTQKKDKKTSVDNIDIIMSSPVESSDTMPLILSEEERNILNKEIDKRQGKNKASKALKKSNAKIHGSIRKLLSYGVKLTLPLLVITFALCLWPISWLISNRGFLFFFSLLKYVIIYLTIQTATNSAFKSIGLRLKRSVISFFVLVQILVYLLIDTSYIYFTQVDEQSLEALLHVLSPKIKTMAVFILLAFLLLLSNYNKIKEKEGVGIFVGWYLVIALVITVSVILLELLLATILWPVLDKLIF